MPALIGQDEITAQRRLDVAHLNRKVNYVSAPQWPHAAVIDQTPAPGARLAASTQVELTVAK